MVLPFTENLILPLNRVIRFFSTQPLPIFQLSFPYSPKNMLYAEHTELQEQITDTEKLL